MRSGSSKKRYVANEPCGPAPAAMAVMLPSNCWRRTCAVLELDGAPHVAWVHATGQRHCGRAGPAHPVNENRLKMAACLLLLALRQSVGGLHRSTDGGTQSLENGDEDILVGRVHGSVTALIRRLHAVRLGQKNQFAPGRPPLSARPHEPRSRMSRMPRAGMSTQSGRLLVS